MVAGLVAGAVALAPTLMNIGSKASKAYGKYGTNPFAQSAQFGLGYGGFTAIGYNLVPQFGKRSTNKVQRLSLNNEMPYGSYRRTRKIRVWSKRYRRYIWVVPRKTYGRRYTKYRRRGYY